MESHQELESYIKDVESEKTEIENRLKSAEAKAGQYSSQVDSLTVQVATLQSQLLLFTSKTSEQVQALEAQSKNL